MPVPDLPVDPARRYDEDLNFSVKESEQRVVAVESGGGSGAGRRVRLDQPVRLGPLARQARPESTKPPGQLGRSARLARLDPRGPTALPDLPVQQGPPAAGPAGTGPGARPTTPVPSTSTRTSPAPTQRQDPLDERVVGGAQRPADAGRDARQQAVQQQRPIDLNSGLR